jgi:anaerobic selenocysteine-containing dehydrogenase
MSETFPTARPSRIGTSAPGQEQIEFSPQIADRVATTTCYMCACRCGIRVHLKDGRIRHIEGNRNHPVNKGVLCAKGSAGIMNHYSPARLTKPLLRVGERGSGDFKEIEWEEALQLATSWLGKVRDTDPRKLAFFTGRDQSQSFTGWWASAYGTLNFAAHGGFCSVNMAAGGLYSVGGSFWEFGEPDWQHTKYFLMFGVAEDHDSNPIKAGLAKLKARGAKYVAINPVRTGYAAVADEWLGIRPGTDGLFILSLVHVLLAAERVDLEFLTRYTNATHLVIRNPGGPDDGLFARGADTKVLAWDLDAKAPVEASTAGTRQALVGEVTLPDGRVAVPVFELLAGRYLQPEYAPESVAERCGVPAATIRRIAAEIADVAFNQPLVLNQPWTDTSGRRHETMVGRPVAIHAMRGISAHSNGFHTCRALHMLQMLLGAIDTPGSWRYKAPYPKPIPPGPPPGGKTWEAGKPLAGMALGFPRGPEDLLVAEDGTPLRLDKAFSWEAPLGLHGLMHMLLPNAHAGDPYPVDVVFMYMANMAWNSSMDPIGVSRMMTERDPATGNYKIPHIIYSDAFYSETVAHADLVLPDTTYLERWDCISLLDRPIGSPHGPADAIRQPILKPDRDVRPFQDVLIELGTRLSLPGFVAADGSRIYADYKEYIWKHERKPGTGPLGGFRGDGTGIGVGAPNPGQLDAYIANDCFWSHELAPEEGYFKHANKAYLATATRLGMIGAPEQIVMQLYSEPLAKFRLAAQGHGTVQPPDRLRARIERYFDPLPIWYPPLEEAMADAAAYPLHAVTQRPAAMYHSWHSQNAWLRQIHGHNVLFVHHATAAGLGLADEDWAWVISRNGRVKVQVRLMDGVNPGTVWTWNAIGKRAGAWALGEDAAESREAFLLNHVMSVFLPPDESGQRLNADPLTGQAAWYDARVRIEKAAADEAAETVPRPALLRQPKGMKPAPDILRYNASKSAST